MEFLLMCPSQQEYFLGESLSTAKEDANCNRFEKCGILTEKACKANRTICNYVQRYKNYMEKRKKSEQDDKDNIKPLDDNENDSCASIFDTCYLLNRDVEFNEKRTK